MQDVGAPCASCFWFRRCAYVGAQSMTVKNRSGLFHIRFSRSAELRAAQALSSADRSSMGVNRLLPFLKAIQKKSLSSLKGKKAAIDASCWLHKTLAISNHDHGNERTGADPGFSEEGSDRFLPTLSSYYCCLTSPFFTRKSMVKVFAFS